MVLYLRLKNWLENEEGQDLIEYVLIAGLIALVAVIAITATGVEVRTIWEKVVAQLKTVP